MPKVTQVGARGRLWPWAVCSRAKLWTTSHCFLVSRRCQGRCAEMQTGTGGPCGPRRDFENCQHRGEEWKPGEGWWGPRRVRRWMRAWEKPWGPKGPEGDGGGRREKRVFRKEEGILRSQNIGDRSSPERDHGLRTLTVNRGGRKAPKC